MKKYNRVMLGRGGRFAKMCREEGYIGGDFDINVNLSDFLFDNWRDFNQKFIPVWMENVPGKSKTAASVACGFLWTIVKGLQKGDIVICPSGEGTYYVGTISGDYYYVPNTDLPHRRPVVWMDKVISRKAMSEKLRNSTGAIGTCCNITNYAAEIDALIEGKSYVNQNPTNESPSSRNSFDERSLHKLFCNYLRSRNIYAKTIFHEKSSNRVDSAQKWVHPDIVGVQFEEFKNDATLSLLKAAGKRKSNLTIN